MTLPEIIQRLKEIRAASNCRPVVATENDLSRLISAIEKHEKEIDDEWNSLLSGKTLVSMDAKLSYRLVR